MSPTSKIVLLAIATGAIGLAAGFLASGGGRQLALGALATDAGQRIAARSAPAGRPGRSPTLIGERRPALALPDLDGRARNLDEFGARPVLVNFLASWCSPCRRELPELDRFAQSGSATNVQVVGVAVEAAGPAGALLAEVPVSFPVLVAGDAGIGLMPGFGNSSGTLPYSVLIDANGKLVARKLGAFEPGTTEAWIADALGTD